MRSAAGKHPIYSPGFPIALLQGWEAARDHARSAVETDNRLRRWLPGPNLSQGPPAGLLYRCTLGNIDLTAPLGELLRLSLSQWSQPQLTGMLHRCTLGNIHLTASSGELLPFCAQY